MFKFNEMMKKVLYSLLFIVVVKSSLFAEEGMLIPTIVSAFESDMQAMGMKLTAKDIYDANNSSIKDAIIHFGGGCTAEIVSDKGLILTNHHCGFSQIQSHSSLENDYLKYGFWAKDLSEELANPGLTAARMVKIEDVTSSVLFGVKEEDTEELRSQTIKKNIKQLIKDFTLNTHYTAEIKPFNYGNDYYVIIKETFNDIRLVGAPPSSIGKFGGDTDNWVWPRHTGDFSVFRIYANVDNKPADFSENNVPYTPLHFLPISMKDRKNGDFTMVYGFPGSTEQHLVSGHLKYIIEKERPARISMREKSLSVIDAAMRSSDAIRIKYAAKQARIANGYKKWIGQVGGLKELGAVDKKIAFEKEYNQRANSKQEWKEKYASIMDSMNLLTSEKSSMDFAYVMAIEYLYVGSELFDLAGVLNSLERNHLALSEKGELDAKISEMITGADGFFKNYDVNVDKEIFRLQSKEYFDVIKGYEDIDTDELVEEIFSKSILVNKERYVNFLKSFKSKKSIKKLKKDSGYKHWNLILSDFRANSLAGARAFNQKMDVFLKVFLEGKKLMFPEIKHWADANSTLRITYGKLEGSSPTDGMKYIEHTTTNGILQKHQTGNPDFELLPELVDLYQKKDFGEYAQDGDLWVCFTGSNHTTGGNSGSPVLDANGYLMGLNFDRSWESTMSDYMFDASRCRNIVVDIKYVLWVMDKYAGAKYLVDEMTLMK
jgi:hypothetical protein